MRCIDSVEFHEKKPYNQTIKPDTLLDSIFKMNSSQVKHMFFMELLLKSVKTIGGNDRSSDKDVQFQIQEIYDELTIMYDYEDSTGLDEFIKSFITIYNEKEQYIHFKGEVAEYIVYTLAESDLETTHLYHEPQFLLEGCNIFKNQFKGWRCLIDVVQRKGEELVLIECKSNLLNKYRPIKGEGLLTAEEKFEKKVTLMRKSKEYFLNTYNETGSVMIVEAYVATFVSPLGKIPQEHSQTFKTLHIHKLFESQKHKYIN